MTSGHQPVLHALSVEPPVAHPGDAVQITFRAQNLSCGPSAAGRVRFLLAAGFELLTEGDASIAVPSVAPGAEALAQISARLCGPVDDGTSLAIQAVLEAGGIVYGTNVCTVVACSRPVLDGPRSGVFVDSIDAQWVRVRAVLTNEGDGPAYDVRLVIPAPLGTLHGDDRGETSHRLGESRAFTKIDVGETVAVAFEARIVAPIGVVRADDAYVEFARDERRALPARADVVIAPDLAAPELTLAAEHGCLGIGVAVRNDGWADARDVRISVTLPPPLHVPAESVVVDGARLPQRSGRRRPALSAFARFETGATGAAIVLDRVPARSSIRFHCSARGSAAVVCGDAVVVLAGESAERTTVVPFTLEPVRDVRARIVGAPRCVAPGETAALVIEVVNRGDVVETFDLAVDSEAACDCPASLTVEPGHARLTTLVARAPLNAARGVLQINVSCCDASGERARVEAEIAVRDFTRHDPYAAPEAPHVHVVAHDLSATRYDACVAPVSAELTAPRDVTAGETFVVRAVVEVGRTLDLLTLHAEAERGARYVSGSTTLDGRVVLDRDHTSPLHGSGLRLNDVPAGTRLTLTWSLIVDVVTDEPLSVGAHSIADGVRVEWEPLLVAAHAGDAFAVRPAGLAYHVDARTTDPAAVPPEPRRTSLSAATPRAAETEVTASLNSDPPAAPQRPEVRIVPPEEPAWIVRLDGARAETLAHALGSVRGNTLVSHLLALRVVLPDIEDARDAAPSRALAELRAAVESVFERLAVKLRIPGFNVDCSDLEDPAMRRALGALFALGADAACAVGFTPPLDGAPLDGVPFGAPVALRALIALTPSLGDEQPSVAAALRTYAGALDAALATFEGVALPFFEDALMRDAGTALAEARAAALAQLRGATALAGAA